MLVMTIGALVIIGTIVTVGLVLELCAVLKAPLGYQDEQGFHAGVKEACGDED
jgi:hypothetical protein